MSIIAIGQGNEHARIDDDHQEPLPAESLGENVIDSLGQIGAPTPSVAERPWLPAAGALTGNLAGERRQHRQRPNGLLVVKHLDQLVQLLLGGHVLQYAVAGPNHGNAPTTTPGCADRRAGPRRRLRTAPPRGPPGKRQSVRVYGLSWWGEVAAKEGLGEWLEKVRPGRVDRRLVAGIDTSGSTHLESDPDMACFV